MKTVKDFDKTQYLSQFWLQKILDNIVSKTHYSTKFWPLIVNPYIMVKHNEISFSLRSRLRQEWPSLTRSISLTVITKIVSRQIAKCPQKKKSSPAENHCSRSFSKCSKIRGKFYNVSSSHNNHCFRSSNKCKETI